MITDPGLAGLPMISDAIAANQSADLPTGLFSNVQPNPIGKNVTDGVAAYHDGNHDGVIAWGGGSAVDAAKAVALREAMSAEFARYARRVVENAAVLAAALHEEGLRIVSGGTDNHLMCVDLRGTGLTGKEASWMLEDAGIAVNKNQIPYDPQPPLVTSGIRLGTPAVTTRGMGATEMTDIARLIGRVLCASGKESVLCAVREEVLALCERFPLPMRG